MVDETRDASPASEDTSGTPSPEDVKQEGSGGVVQAVPYHRFQKKVWEAQELSDQLQNLTREVEELRSHKPEPVQEDAPDRDEDPVGYAEHIALKAQRTAQSATERLENFEAQQERSTLLAELQGEFATAIAKYPALDDDEDMREFAWEKFIVSKDKTQGRATGDEIIAGLHSRFQQFADSSTPEAVERRKLRGKAKSEKTPPVRKKAWEKDRDIPQGVPGNMNGKMSFSQKLDRAMRDRTGQVMERMGRQDKRMSGM